MKGCLDEVAAMKRAYRTPVVSDLGTIADLTKTDPPPAGAIDGGAFPNTYTAAAPTS